MTKLQTVSMETMELIEEQRARQKVVDSVSTGLPNYLTLTTRLPTGNYSGSKQPKLEDAI